MSTGYNNAANLNESVESRGISPQEDINRRIANFEGVNPQTQLTTIKQRAFQRIDADPFTASKFRAADLYNIDSSISPSNKLEIYKDLLNTYTVDKFMAASSTRADLWKSQKVGGMKEQQVYNPAVVQQIKESIRQGEPVSDFLPGGQFSTQLRSETQMITPETALALELMSKQEGNFEAKRKYQSYYSRPGVKEYTDLFTSGGRRSEVSGVYFQFQNTQLISNLINQKDVGFKFVTQQLDEKAFTAKETVRSNILAGNELFLAISNSNQLAESPNKNVYGVKSGSSFHPKIGYVARKESGDQLSFGLAFISSQNITSALSTNRTIESLFVFDSSSDLNVERQIYSEISKYTDSIIDQARQTRDLVAENINIKTTDNKFLYTSKKQDASTEIGERYYSLIEQVAQSPNDRLVIAMSEFTSKGLSSAAKTNLTTLASQNRLTVVIDKKRLNKAAANDLETFNLYKMLARQGALQIVPTVMLHEKSLTVYNSKGGIEALATGSANLTKSALYGDNTEVSVVFGSERYQDLNRQQDSEDVEAYLSKIGNDPNYRKHMSFLTGNLYNSGYLAERRSKYLTVEKERVANIKKLANDINLNNVSSLTNKGLVEVNYRYNTDFKVGFEELTLEPVGLDVKIKGPSGSHSTTLSLTVNNEGSVVVSNLNKTFNQALYVNKTDETQQLFAQGADNLDGLGVRSLEVVAGASVKLNSFEVALGYINTIQRQFAYQSTYELNDLYFKQLFIKSNQKAINLSENFLVSTLGGESDSLAKKIQAISTIENVDDRLAVSSKLIEKIVGTNFTNNLDSIFELNIDKRHRALSSFSNYLNQVLITNANLTEEAARKLSGDISEQFLSALIIDAEPELGSKTLADIRKLFIYSEEDTRKAYIQAAKTQSTSIRNSLLDPFLAAHELSSYDSYQGKSRMPVYGESTPFGAMYDSNQEEQRTGEFLAQGILNPLAYGATTRLAGSGKVWRALGSASAGDKLSLPGLGGLRQLTILDTDISTGAGVVHDYEILADSTSNLRRFYLKDIQAEIARLQSTGLITSSQSTDIQQSEILNRIFKDGETEEEIALMYSTFTKAERLTQRIKNLVGSRAKIDIDSRYIKSQLDLFTTDEEFLGKYNIDTKTKADDRNIIGGKLRTALGTAQLKEIDKVRQILAKEFNTTVDNVTFEQVEEYFKEDLLNLNNTQKGFIGAANLKRVGLVSGASLFGDVNYLNAGYESAVAGGIISNTRIKINPNRLESAIGDQVDILSIFNRPGIITTTNFKGEDGATYKPGFYIQGEDKTIRQVATYTKDGLLAFNNIFETYETAFGPRKQALKFKAKAFSLRAQDGLTLIKGKPNLTIDDRGINYLEFQTISVDSPTSGMRPASGDGLLKGPFSIINQQFFERLDETFLDAYTEDPVFRNLLNVDAKENLLKQKTFGLLNLSNYKGFAFKGATSIIASNLHGDFKQSSFGTLLSQSGVDVAKSLAMMFLGDKEVSSSLANITADPLQKSVLLNNTKALDITKKGKFNSEVNNLALVASGFLGLSSDPTDLELNTLKQDVIDVLQGDSTKGRALKLKAQQLLLAARGSGVQYGTAQYIKDKVNTDKVYAISPQVQLDESDGLVKAASIYAGMTLFRSQLLSDNNDLQAKLKTTRFSLNEQPLDIVKLYHNFEVTKTGKVIPADDIATQGLTSDSYRNLIDLIDSSLGNKLRKLDTDKTGEELYEDYQYNSMILRGFEATIGKSQVFYMPEDISLSQSLVPAGMKDSVKYEYSSYLRLTDERLKLFRQQFNLESDPTAINIQQAYFGMISLLNNNLYSVTSTEAGLSSNFRLPFIGEANTQDGYNLFSSAKEFDMLNLANLYISGRTTSKQLSNALDADLKTFDSVGDYVKAKLSGHTTMESIPEVDRLISTYERTAQTSDAATDYIGGLLALETSLIQKINNNQADAESIKARQFIGSSKNLVIPNLIYEPSTSKAGYYDAKFAPLEGGNLDFGILLGTDILRNVGMVFGDYESDIIKTQLALVKDLQTVQPVMDKLKSNQLLNAQEIVQYEDFVKSARNSYTILFDLLESDITRQAYGDHESFRGSVGIPTNTNLLNPWEMVVGERALRLAGESGQKPMIGQLIDSLSTQISLESQDLDKSYQLASSLINTYTTRVEGKDTYKTTADSVEKLFDTVTSITPDSRNLLERVYSEIRGKEAKVYTKDNFKSLSITESNLLVSSLMYSEILDLGFDNTQDAQEYILKELITDRISTDDKSSLPKSFDKLISSNKYSQANAKNTIERLSYLALGVMSQRTGHPGGSAAAISENDNYQLYSTDLVTQRATALAQLSEFNKEYYQQQFTPGKKGSETTMMVPSISRFLAMLGDYDGDSHRIVVNQTEHLLQKINRTQERAFNLREQATKLEVLSEVKSLPKYTSSSDIYIDYLNSLRSNTENILTIPAFRDMREIDVLRKLNKISKATFNTNLRTKELSVDNKIYSQTRAVGNQIASNLPLANVMHRSYLKANNEGAVGFERLNTYLDLISPDSPRDLYGKRVKNLINSSNVIELIGRNNNSESFRALDSNDLQTAAGIAEFDLQIGIFEQEQLSLSQLSEYINSIDKNNKDRKVLEVYRKVEQKRLMSDQLKIVNNVKEYLIANKEVTGGDLNSFIARLNVAQPELQAELNRQATELEQEIYGEDEDALLNRLTKLQDYRRVAESRSTEDIERFIKMYTGLPDFVTDSMSLGQMTGLVSQKFSMDGIVDYGGEGYYNTNLARTSLMQYLIDSSEVTDSSFYDTSLEEFESRLNNLDDATRRKYGINQELLIASGYVDPELSTVSLNRDRLALDLQMLREEFRLNPEQGLVQSMYTAYGRQSNLEMTISEGQGGILKKATGQILDPFEFDAAIQTIAEGGTKLIGEAYNTLMPLLDQAMIEAPFTYQTTSDVDQIFGDYLDTLDSKEDRATVSSLAKKLGVAGFGEAEELANNRQQLNEKFYSAVGVISSFQQIVRDALKPPGASDSTTLFNSPIFHVPVINLEGEELLSEASLAQVLRWDDDNYSTTQKDLIRKKAVNQFLGQVLGTTLNDRYSDSKLKSNNKEVQTYMQSIEGRQWTNNITGFGALMMLSEYAATEEGDFYNKFIEDNTIYGFSKSDYENWAESTAAISKSLLTKEALTQEYIKTRIIDLMQRTQAGFAAESIRSAGNDNIDSLSNRIITAYNQAPESEQISPYRGIIENYVASESADNYGLVNDILLAKLQEEQARTGSFTSESIDYLRRVKQDYKEIDQSGEITPTQLQLMSIESINNSIRRLRRGKLKDKMEAITMGGFQIENIAQVLSKADFDDKVIDKLMSGDRDIGSLDREQLTAASILVGNVAQISADASEKKALVRMLLSRNQEGQLRLYDLAQKSAGLAKQQAIVQSVAARQNQSNYDFMSIQGELDQALSETVLSSDGGLIDTDKINAIYNQKPQITNEQLLNTLEQERMTIEANLNLDSSNKTRTQNKAIRANYMAETVGVLSSPLLFALAGSGVALDERALGFTVDVAQGLAETSVNTATLTNQYLNNEPNSASLFSQARMRTAISAEGLAIGAIQGVGQELMYKSISELSSNAVGLALANTRSNPNIVNIGGGLGAEILGSVLAQGVSKAMFKARASRGSTPTGSSVSRLLNEYIEQVWLAAEEAQMQLVNQDYVVLDTETNEEIDFEVDAYLSDSEIDIMTGLLVLDPEAGKALESDFEEYNPQLFTTAGTKRFG